MAPTNREAHGLDGHPGGGGRVGCFFRFLAAAREPEVQVSRVRDGALASTRYNPELVYSPLVSSKPVGECFEARLHAEWFSGGLSSQFGMEPLMITLLRKRMHHETGKPLRRAEVRWCCAPRSLMERPDPLSQPESPSIPRRARRSCPTQHAPAPSRPPRFPPLTLDHLFSCRTVSLTSGCGARSTGFLNRDLRFGFANSNPHWDSIELIVASVATRIKIPGFLVDEMAESRKWAHNIHSSFSIADTGVGARGEPPMSLEPGMTAPFARARARGTQAGVILALPRQRSGWSALAMGEQFPTKSCQVCAVAIAGQVWTRVRAGFHPVGRGIVVRAWRRYPLCFSAFPCCSGAFRPAIARGSQRQ